MRSQVYIFILLSTFCSCKQDSKKISQNDFFETVGKNDIPLPKPKEGEWLYDHPEQGQNLASYINSSPLSKTEQRNIIYLKPYGEFSKHEQKVLAYTADYLEAIYQTKTTLLEISADDIIPDTARRVRADGNEQLLAPHFIDNVLKKNIPEDGIVLMAITAKDLYPKKEWNFVFGLASYHERIGVSSMKRLYRAAIDSLNYGSCLNRLIKIASHEIGHMFTLKHCIYAFCTMNGSNSLEETDVQPNRLCSECLKKINTNFKFDNQKRLKSLQEYFYLHRMMKDYNTITKDVDITE